MKVSAGDYIAVAIRLFRIFHEYEWIVDRRVRLPFHDLATVGEAVAHGAVDLRHAAQRVGILHTIAMAMRFVDFAAFNHLPKIRRRPDLSGMRAGSVNALVEGRHRSHQSIQAKGADDVG